MGWFIHSCMRLICELHRYTSLQSRPQNMIRTNRFTVCILIIVTMHSNPTATEELALLIEWSETPDLKLQMETCSDLLLSQSKV